VVPGALFYVALVFGGVGVAYLVGLAWTYGCVAVRVIGRRAVPTILLLGVIGTTARTALAVGTGSSFVYFAQPILLTVLNAALFLATLWVGRPMIERLACDFWPVTPEIAQNPRIDSLFRGLTVLWAGVNLAIATITFVLLVNLPVASFVAVKQVAVLFVNVVAAAVTIWWAHSIACREGLVTTRVRV